MAIFSFVLDQLKNNQFSQASLIAAPAAGLMYLLRRFPGWLTDKIIHIFTIDLRINSDQSGYQDISDFITNKVVNERFTRKYSLSSEEGYIKRAVGNERWITTAKKLKGCQIGYGKHIGYYKGHIVFIYKNLESNNNGDSFKEHLICRFVTFSKPIINQLFLDIKNHVEYEKSTTKTIIVYSNTKDGWSSGDKITKRPINSIILPDSQVDLVINHIREFEKRADWTRDKGLPNRTGILLSGKPGCAKSSLIHALASELDRDIYNLNLSAVLTDEQLTHLFSNKEFSNAIVVVEDIDATGAGVGNRENDDKSTTKKNVSLSTLLNCFDGLMTPDGLCLIATTNHVENIDPALLRRGRFDLKVELGLLDKSEFERMALLFDLDPSEYALDYFTPMTGADIRYHLLDGGVKSIVEYQKSIPEKGSTHGSTTVTTKSTYEWTDEDINWTDVDALEVWGTQDLGETTEPCTSDKDTPDYYSVFIHLPQRGITCVADRDTKEEALELAKSWGLEKNILVHDYTSCM